MSTNLKNKRIKNGWTLQYVGDQVGVSNQTISSIENSKTYPSYEVLCKLENLFKKSHRWLLEPAPSGDESSKNEDM